jgi:eukaryotic-like serine/threonine-protein kinase
MVDEADDGVDDGVDTVRSGPEPVATLQGIGALYLTDVPSPLDLSLDRTRRDSPGARQRGDMRVPLSAEQPRYRLGEVLGEGGMGEVLLAQDVRIGREVAIKRIRAADPSAEELSRFVREARVQGGLEHPAVVPVHDLAVDHDGRPFFVMKRLSGTTMQDLLAGLRTGDDADQAGTRRRLLRAFADVCLAVEFAHSRRIVHRDLKPANIMLGDFGEVYVLDWGVARAVTEGDLGPDSVSQPFAADLRLDTGDTLVGTVLGTPAYMAPEQLAGDRAGPAADVYALGCILYEIVAGVALHAQGRSLGDLARSPVARPSQRRADAPPELDAVCERATHLEPEARFASARALGAAVQAFLDGDRDVSARSALAKQHIAEARAALAGGESEEHRRTAMRAAGRALALDPTASEAADLVTHLMLRPPRIAPDEVERQLEVIDIRSARHHGRLAAFALLGYLGFVPLLLWTGVRDPVFVVAFALLAAGSCLHVYMLSRRTELRRGGIYLNAFINALLIALISRIVGPFIIAPTLATTTLMAYAAHPRFGRITVMAAILGAAVAVPWALELAGVLSSTYRFTDGGELVLGSAVVSFSAAPVQVAFAVLLVALLGVVGVLSRGQAQRQREATRKLELHAWHLRQVLPSLPR